MNCTLKKKICNFKIIKRFSYVLRWVYHQIFCWCWKYHPHSHHHSQTILSQRLVLVYLVNYWKMRSTDSTIIWKKTTDVKKKNMRVIRDQGKIKNSYIAWYSFVIFSETGKKLPRKKGFWKRLTLLSLIFSKTFETISLI